MQSRWPCSVRPREEKGSQVLHGVRPGQLSSRNLTRGQLSVTLLCAQKIWPMPQTANEPFLHRMEAK